MYSLFMFFFLFQFLILCVCAINLKRLVHQLENNGTQKATLMNNARAHTHATYKNTQSTSNDNGIRLKLYKYYTYITFTGRSSNHFDELKYVI